MKIDEVKVMKKNTIFYPKMAKFFGLWGMCVVKKNFLFLQEVQKWGKGGLLFEYFSVYSKNDSFMDFIMIFLESFDQWTLTLESFI